MARRRLVHQGSGNVFADIGVANPEEALLKAELVRSITNAIDERVLTQTAAAAMLGVSQPKVSLLYRGRLDAFSVERLLRFLNALGRDVRIVVGAERRRRAGRTVVEARSAARIERRDFGIRCSRNGT
jgi:predicted XRE-type DNA-binding protein